MTLEQLSPFDRACLEETVSIGSKGNSRVLPNPRVGALIVRDGVVVGRGWHQVCGEAHAEINAINQSQGPLKGATLYVSLEPCAHQGRTPSCAERILKEGFNKVVYAMNDPGHGKGGAERLRQAGVEVLGPVEFPAARKLIAPFQTLSLHRRAHITLKWAMTLDGHIALASGDSKWITGEEARTHAHQVRSQVDGIMIGARTALCDAPALSVRHGIEGPDPRPLIWNPRGRLDQQHPSKEWWDAMRKRQALIISDQGERSTLEVLPWNDGVGFAKSLLERGFHHVLAEGGAGLLGALMDLDLADDALVYLSPKVCGGKGSLSPVGGVGVSQMNLAHLLSDLEVTPLGQDFLISGSFVRNR